MSYDINQVTLVGRLTKDPELSYTKTNMAICKFCIANNQGQDKTNFFNIIAFDKLAKTCSEYLKKGSQIILSGKLNQNVWQDKNNNNRISIDIIANSVQFLSPSGKQSSTSSTIPEDELPF